MLRTGCLVLLLGRTLASPVEAHRAQDEKQLEEIVRDALELSGVDTDAVQVKVRGRVAFLSGVVKTARDKIRAIQAAFSVSEVEEVESGLEVRSGGTPEIEEQIWLLLLQEGLDSFVTEVLVKDGVASVRGEVPDPATRERVLSVARVTPGIASVRDEIVIPKAAEETPAEPSPPAEPPKVPAEMPLTPPPLPPPPEPPAAPAEVEPRTAPPPEPPEPPPPEPPAVPAQVEPPTVPPPAPEPPGDVPELPQLIVRQILSYRGYTVFDQVQFAVEGVDVTLNGAVTEPAKKQEIEERIRSVPGIGRIENQIRVLPRSKTDDKLRESLFRRIYEDPMFAEFADHPNPPIHIIVEASWVTLTGIVDKAIERMSAEGMVRSAFGVAGVKNQLRVRQ